MELVTQNSARDAVPTPTTDDMAEAVVVEKTALILYAQRPSFTAVEQDSPDH